MRKLARLSAILGVLLAAPLALEAAHLISVNSTNDGSGNGPSRRPQASFGGDWVVFESDATNLVTPGISPGTNIFVRNTQGQYTTLISVNSAGAGVAGNGPSTKPRIAVDAVRIVFESDATDLVAPASSGHQLFARLAYSGPTILVSVNSSGNGSGNGSSHDAVITPDGRYVVFLSNATNLVSGVTANGLDQVYLRDLQAGLTKMVSVDGSGLNAGGLPSLPPLSVSDDGRYVTFTSNAILTSNDGNGLSDVYMRDVMAATTSLVSQSQITFLAGNGASFGGQISRDGSVVLYTSRATDLQNLIIDGNGGEDVYLWYRSAGFSQLVSSRRSDNAHTGDGISTTADGGNFLSFSGNSFAFRSAATDIVTGPSYTPGTSNVIDVNAVDGFSYTLDSVDPTNSFAGNQNSGGPISLSHFGEVAAYQSAATNILPGDTNGKVDVFAHIFSSRTNQMASRGLSGASGNGDSTEPFVSDDARFVAFTSTASDLDLLDTNGAVADVFLQRICPGFLVDSAIDSPPASPGSATCASVAGGCTLRAAVDAANSSGGGVICLPSGTYPLTLGSRLTITANVTIDGDGASITIIDALNTTQIFEAGANATMTVNNVQLNNGFSNGDAGAVIVQGGATASFNFVTFNGNACSDGSGGAIKALSGSTLNLYGVDFNNNSSPFVDGGAIACNGLLQLNFSRFNNNQASGDGGAILLTDSAGTGNANTITDAEFYGNKAGTRGGGLYIEVNTQLALANATLGANDSPQGSGLYNAGTVTVINSTISGNVNRAGPGIGFGNGTVGTATLTNCTITGNSSAVAGFEIDHTGTSFKILNSVVKGGPLRNCSFKVQSLGNNIENGLTCGFTGTGDIQSTDAMLGPLQYTGGFEQTHILLPASPAIDAGTNTGCPPFDQRGVARPQGARCDMGSVEVIGITISDVTGPEGNSGTTPFAFTVTLSAPSPNVVTVDYATADGTATLADNDYIAASGTLTFNFGEQVKTITVQVVGDATFEADETFVVNLTNPSGGAVIADNQGVGTILNDDGGASFLGPTPYLSKADSPFLANINAGRTYLETFECGVLTVPGVTPSAGSVLGPSGITDSVDADDGAIDGFGTGGHSFFSPSGAAGITFTFSAAVLGALPTEAGIVWTDGAGTTTFEAFDAAGLSLGQVGPVSIADNFVTGTTGEDRFFGARYAGGISKIKISNTAGGIEVDHLQYGLYSATGADLSIVKSASPDPVALGGTLTYTLAVSNAGPLVACSVTVTDTLPGGVAFVSAGGSGWACVQSAGVVTCTAASLPMGAAPPISITVTAPTASGFLTNRATISSQTPDPVPANNTASVTSAVGSPQSALSIGSVAVVKPASGTVAAVFPVTLSSPSSSTVQVFYATSDGSAKAGVDYQEAASILYIPAGNTTASITVLVNGNTIASDDKLFTLQIFGATGAVVVNGTATGTILDRTPLPSLAIGDATVSAGSTGTTPAVFTLVLSSPTARTVSVNYQTTDGSATVADQDYVSASGTVFFAPLETTKTVTVLVSPKGFVAPRIFFVDLSPAVNALVTRSRGVGTITHGYPALSVGDTAVRAPGSGTSPGTAILSVYLSPSSTQTVTVSYATADRTAVAGLDYTATSGMLTFAPGETTKPVMVPILPRGAVAPTKVFTLTLSSPSNAIVAKGLGDCAIYDPSKPLPPGPFIFIDDLTVSRPGSSFATTARVSVRLTGPSAVPINLAFATNDDTAHAGTDYFTTFGTLTIAPGETLKTIQVLVLRVPAGGGNKAFKVTLADPFFGDLIAAAEGIVTIIGP